MSKSSGSQAVHGSCLCRGATFRVLGKTSDIGHCHCSKCRKVSGVNSNGVVLAAAKRFEWLSGEELVEVYMMDDGWKSTFCRRCGSPLPMLGAGGKLYWIPIGLLDDDPGVEVVRHIHVASKARWELIAGDAEQFDEAPP